MYVPKINKSKSIRAEDIHQEPENNYCEGTSGFQPNMADSFKK